MKRILIIFTIVGLSGFLFAQETNSDSSSTSSSSSSSSSSTETTTTAPVKKLSAEQRYLSDLSKNSKDEAAYNGLLKIYSSQGRHRDRIKIALKAIQNIGNNSSLYVIVGDEYKILGDYSKALVSYQFALKLSPTRANIYNRMGLILLKLKSFHRAETAFKGAIFFVNDDKPVAKGVYLNNLGVSYEARNDFKNAAKFFRATLRYYPSYSKAQNNLKRVEEALRSQG